MNTSFNITKSKTSPNSLIVKMTTNRINLLKEIMEWFWSFNDHTNMIPSSDFEFMYSLWKRGVSFYNKDTQIRLNKIRDIYIKSIKNKHHVYK